MNSIWKISNWKFYGPEFATFKFKGLLNPNEYGFGKTNNPKLINIMATTNNQNIFLEVKEAYLETRKDEKGYQPSMVLKDFVIIETINNTQQAVQDEQVLEEIDKQIDPAKKEFNWDEDIN